jgi:hypothetical protein
MAENGKHYMLHVDTAQTGHSAHKLCEVYPSFVEAVEQPNEEIYKLCVQAKLEKPRTSKDRRCPFSLAGLLNNHS